MRGEEIQSEAARTTGTHFRSNKRLHKADGESDSCNLPAAANGHSAPTLHTHTHTRARAHTHTHTQPANSFTQIQTTQSDFLQPHLCTDMHKHADNLKPVQCYRVDPTHPPPPPSTPTLPSVAST